MNLEYGWALDKNRKNTASVFRVFDLLYIHIKPYESELLTALSECKAVARCATRKTDTAINRIKTLGARKQWPHSENSYGDEAKNSWLANCVTWKMNVAINSKLMSITLHISYSHKNELKCGLTF